MKITKRMIFLILAFFLLFLGSLGIFIPVLPTVPFFIAAAFCLSKSSKTLEAKLINSRVYKKTVGEFKNERGLTIKKKIKIISLVTLVFTLAFVGMSKLKFSKYIIIFVYLLHVLFILFKVKTDRETVKK